MRKALFVLAVLMLAGFASDARAQTVPSVYEYIETRHAFGLFGGYVELDDGSRDLGPGPAPLFGARYGIRLAGPLLGGLELGFAPTTRTLYDRPNPNSTDLLAIGEDDMVIMAADAELRFVLTGERTWRRLAPYIVAAGGLALDLTPGSATEEGLEANQLYRFGPTFAARGGAGTELFLTDRISIRAEFRDNLWRLNYPVGLTGLQEEQTEWRHNFGVTIGSSFNF